MHVRKDLKVAFDDHSMAGHSHVRLEIGDWRAAGVLDAEDELVGPSRDQ